MTNITMKAWGCTLLYLNYLHTRNFLLTYMNGSSPGYIREVLQWMSEDLRPWMSDMTLSYRSPRSHDSLSLVFN